MNEIELKVLLDEAGARAVGAAAAAMAGASARRRRLRSVYYDTAEGALKAGGIALRLRKAGNAWVQTAKRGGGSESGGLFTPEESESPATGGRLDLARLPGQLGEDVRATLGDAPLVPVFETDITRDAVEAATPLGRVEVAVDQGAVIAGERRATLVEAELELKSGAPPVLYDVARVLLADAPFRFSHRSKAARGDALAAGEPAVPGTAPRLARAVRLRRKENAEAAAARVLRECLAQIDANRAACLASDEPEGPHQLRIGLRRLRSALGLFRPALHGPALDALNDAARDIGREVGRLRDLDVIHDETVAPEAALDGPEKAGFAALAEALEARRIEVRAEVRAALSAPRVQLFLLDLSAFIELRGWLRPHDHAQTAVLAEPVSTIARDALDKRWRRTRRSARRLEHLTLDERHALRKELKKLRYGVEFLGDLWPRDRVRPFRKRLKALQDDFGALNDVAVAEHLLTGPGAPAADSPAAQRAVGRLLGARGRDADLGWEHARGAWRALEKLGPCWR